MLIDCLFSLLVSEVQTQGSYWPELQFHLPCSWFIFWKVSLCCFLVSLSPRVNASQSYTSNGPVGRVHVYCCFSLQISSLARVAAESLILLFCFWLSLGKVWPSQNSSCVVSVMAFIDHSFPLLSSPGLIASSLFSELWIKSHSITSVQTLLIKLRWVPCEPLMKHVSLIMLFSTLKEWIQDLKSYCTNTQPKTKPKSLYPALTELRSLQIKIFDARKLSIKHAPHPYCILSLNDVNVCRTQVKEAPEPCWDEEFMLE